ncbi:response regulator transcription factor [Gemmobacter serpentinus]|uniref:response regulator transcription factor n=1 Tax=Gemmobacter serpentinus TaxID=2652247 RepID=UPI00124C626C|nr:response regulator transcription factor [Gemmobacter serpentinus]
MTYNAVRVLVVDDEQPIRKLLRMGLGAEGFAVIEARNGREADALLAEENPDLVLLDLGLPDRNGHEILTAWRADLKTVPVVVLSSRTDEAGIVRALELGADDYVTKPFGMKELAARIRVALRHVLSSQGEQPVFRTGALSVDLVRRIVVVDGEEVKLSPKEYDILRILVTHAGKVITHQHLMREIWDETTDVQYLRVYVRQLRQKLNDSPDAPRFIRTETGVGYRLREAD